MTEEDSPGAYDTGCGLKTGIMCGKQAEAAEANFERGPHDGRLLEH